MARKMIVWTSEEKDRIQNKARIIARKSKKAMTMASLLTQAQSALPKSRHRKIFSVDENNNNSWFFEFVTFHIPDSKIKEPQKQNRKKVSIRWSKEEFEMICDWVLLNHPDADYNVSAEKLFIEAQKAVLPSERHVFVDIEGRIKKFKKTLAKLKKIRHKPIQPKTVEDIEVKPTRSDIDIIKSASVEQLKMCDRSSLIEAVIQQFIDETATKVAMLLDQTIKQALTKEIVLPAQQKQSEQKTPIAASTAVKPLKKIAIIGLLPRQVQNVKAIYGNSAKFTFIDSTQMSKVGNSLADKDYVICMKDFTPHAGRNIINKNNYKLCVGGISSLSKMLDSLTE